MKTIELTQGQVTLVDDEDFEWLSRWKWCALRSKTTKNYYAVRNIRPVNNNNKRGTVLMHREILGLKYGDKRQGDHRDHNTLNNRRTNLRIVTNAENQYNRKVKKGVSEYKGVSWHEQTKKWRAQIMVGGDAIHLGLFKDKKDAACAYDKAAGKHFGEYAHTNF